MDDVEQTGKPEAVVSSAPATEKSAVDARQGVISGRVLLVLITSIAFTIVAFTVGFCTMK